MNFNKAIIAGNLTRDPEIRSLPSGQSVASFGVASNRRYTDQQGNRQEKTEFHNIVAFGKWADICSQYVKKGMPILVEGRLQTNNWQGQDGVKRYRTEIIMEFMQMGPRLAGASSTAPNEPLSQPKSEQTAPSQEEIPVIEAEEPISQSAEPAKEENKNENSDQNTKNPESMSDGKEEVDVKNIPF